jgi:hypothetical protein
MLAAPVAADRLRISPDDLRLRVAVSEELPASLRREIRDLARVTPLPVEDGLIQTERLIEETFAGRGWKTKRSTMVRYYFLVARLEQSQKFSDEFLRRRSLLEKGVTLLEAYIDTLNRQIARAVYTDAAAVSPEVVAAFPLEEVEKTDSGELLILHRFPPPEIGLGRENLRVLRELASEEKGLLEERLESLQGAESRFLAEVSLLGKELIAMREQVRGWVRVPGEGLPFSF